MKNIVFLLGFFLLVFASCTKKFDILNTDPNRPQTITPGVLLGQLQYRLVNQGIEASRSFTHELMQVTAPRSSTNDGIHRYVLKPNNTEGFWTNLYVSLLDVQDLYTISDKIGESNYKGISLIYRCWAYSLLTDVFGDVPFSQATQASSGNITPVFDHQKDIYIQILKDLETANTLLDDSKALKFGGDLVYNANSLSGTKNLGITQWKKFCNSLRLRLLLRIIKRDGEVDVSGQINALLSNPGKYPLFTSTADDAIFRYPGTFPFFNPYYNARTLDWRRSEYFTKYFINPLNANSDPRSAVWATQVKDAGGNLVYQGIESGYPSTTEYVVDRNSSYSDGLKTLPQLGIMMTFSELEFIYAELELKGFITGSSVQKHYENGIAASMTQWGVSLPGGYLQKPGIQFNALGTSEARLQQIMSQKYYALFFVDYQSWFEKRRTGYPLLPRGSGIPAENQFPSRGLYPIYLQSLNPSNLVAANASIGGDKTTVKVWWDK